MKQLIIASALFIAAAPVLALANPPSAGCAAQRARIEAQIQRAQAEGHQQQLAGLRRALRANETHCSDASLAAERQRAIQKATQKVAEREKELAQAQRKVIRTKSPSARPSSTKPAAIWPRPSSRCCPERKPCPTPA